MLEILSHWFAAVCGQGPGHTWAPGGILLPCCQRCAGLYVGAGVAALLHLALRPKLSGRFLQIHGAFLLTMVPFGFHWVAQGPVLRSLTGVLFGSGVVTFLWLPLGQTLLRPSAFGLPSALDLRPSGFAPSHWPRQPTYFLILVGMLPLLPVAATLGRAFAAYSLSALVFWGALALAALIAGNVSLAMLGTLRGLLRLARPHLQP